MEEYIPYAIIDAQTTIALLGILQALLISGWLILGSKGKKPLRLLGFFILASALQLLGRVFFQSGLCADTDSLCFLPFHFYFLGLPLLYLYIRSLSFPPSAKHYWECLFPGILEFILLSVLFVMSPESRAHWTGQYFFHLVYDIYEALALVYNVFFAWLILRLLAQPFLHGLSGAFPLCAVQVRNGLTCTVFLQLSFVLSYLLLQVVPPAPAITFVYTMLPFIHLMFVLWLSLSGFHQSLQYALEHGLSNKTNPAMILTTEKLSERENALAFERVKSFIQTQKPYISPQLLLSDLARRMGMTQRQLSNLINQYAHTNFNQFINYYRVEEAKRLMLDPAFGHLNLLGIAYEVGFNSKTSFYTIFKQFTGMTPSNYQHANHRHSGVFTIV